MFHSKVDSPRSPVLTMTLGLVCCHIAWAQDVPPPPTQGEINVVQTMKTPERILGTHVLMSIPSGFSQSKSFSGLEAGPDDAILVMDIPGGDFQSNTRNYSKAAFERKGLEVLELERTTQDGYSAIRSVVKSPVNGTVSRQLVFGDSTFSVLISTVSKTFDKVMDARMALALSTVKYDKASVVGRFEGTYFRMDDRHTDLKFSKRAGGAWVFMLSSDSVAGDNRGPMFMAMPVPLPSGSSCEEVVMKQIDGLESKGLIRSSTEHVSHEKVNGFPSYGVELYGKLNEAPIMLYLHAINLGGMVVMCSGTSSSDHEQNLGRFKQLIATISRQ